MDIRTVKCLAAILVGGALLGLGRESPASGQSCCPVILPWPANATTITIDTPWATSGNYDAAANPSYMTARVTAGLVVVPARSDPYLAWCVDAATSIDAGAIPYDGLLYASCDLNLNTALPAGRPSTMYVAPEVWHQVNYLLNHKQGAYFWNVQLAIWALVGGPAPAEYLGGSPYPLADVNVVNQLVADAKNNAANWQLPCGGAIGIVAELYPQATYTPGAPSTIQIVLLEVPCPCDSSTSTTTAQVGTQFVSPPAVPSGSGYTYTVASGSLPPGLTLNPGTGEITGTPTTPGTYTTTIQVTTSSGATSSYTTTMTVEGVSTAEVGTSVVLPPSIPGTGYTVTAGSLPPGLTLNPSTGEITGMPTTPGTYTFTVGFTNSAGVPTSYTSTIIIECPPPEITCPVLLQVKTDPGRCSTAIALETPTAISQCPGAAPGTVTVTGLRNDGLGLTDPYPAGTTVITWTATDSASGKTAECNQSVWVFDKEPPKVTCSVNTSTLWPPNHNLINVGFTAIVTDNCHGSGQPGSGLPLAVKVFSNEDELAQGSGNMSPDAKGLATGTLRLRSERSGLGDGRVYLIAVTASDGFQSGWCFSTVTVTHDQSEASRLSVAAQAAAAQVILANGAPPPGWFVIGNGPIIGPKQ